MTSGSCPTHCRDLAKRLSKKAASAAQRAADAAVMNSAPVLHFALINLNKALGGGWVNEADKLSPQPSVDTKKNPPIFP